MIIFVDDQEIEIFSGALVKDAVLKYSEKVYRDILHGKKQVNDKWKNEVELDGELIDHQHLYIKKNDNPQPGGK